MQTAGLQLNFTPFEIAERLRTYIDSRACAWIFTSATLAIGADFSHFSTRIGLPDARALRIDSPFDYRDQARVYGKQVHGGRGELELSPEEAEAVRLASAGGHPQPAKDAAKDAA